MYVYKIIITIFITHIGKESNSQPDKGFSHRVVMSLVSGLEQKGYHVFTDNFYSSPTLYNDLRSNGFDATGTVRINRKGLSDEYKQKKLSKGTHNYYLTK